MLQSDMDELLAYDYGMWSRGLFLMPRHACYTSAVHTKEDVDTTLEAADEVIRELK
jgi:glutamate-1-semialdehyde aminotransferase